MSEADWIEDPVLKLRMRFEQQDDTLGGEVEVQPGGGIGKHFHPSQEERWSVLEGSVRFRLGREKRKLGAGEGLVVPHGARHALKTVGDSPARLRFTAQPALELEAFLIEAVAMNRAGK